MKLADIMLACKKLRTRKAPMRFRPQLIYLVEVAGISYVHPNYFGTIAGQTAWTTRELWFQCHKDAKDYADTLEKYEKARVVKLNICAFEETICHSTRRIAA